MMPILRNIRLYVKFPQMEAKTSNAYAHTHTQYSFSFYENKNISILKKQKFNLSQKILFKNFFSV